MPTFTQHYAFNKPLPFDQTDADVWGGYLNENFDDIDALIFKSINFPILSKGGDYLVLASDNGSLINANASTASFVLTLPTAVGNAGMSFGIKKTDSTANTVTIDPNATETIDGQTTYILKNQWDSIYIVSDGANWSVLSSNLALTGQNRTYVETATATSSSAIIPFDNTKPQSTEGTLIISGSITPSKATNRIRIKFNAPYVSSPGGNAFAFLWITGETDARQVTAVSYPGGGANLPLFFEYEMVAGLTTPMTFNVNLGVQTSSTVYVNSNNGSAIFNGAQKMILTLEEIIV